MPSFWYALRSKPCKEDFLWKQLRAREIECFYPRTQVQATHRRTTRKGRPYFPGYLFVHADLEQVGLSTLQWMPGAAGLVAFGGQPAWVPEPLIQAIRRRVEQVNAAGGELLAGLRRGDRVRICEGPLAGYQALFDGPLSGAERVRVLLSLLGGQQVPVDLPASQLQRTNQS